MERSKKIINNSEPDKVWASVSSTVNLGNYENIKIEMGYSKSLKDTDNPIKERNKILDDLVEEIIDKSDELKK